MTRSQAIAQIMHRELDHRQAWLDVADDLYSITLTVKFELGSAIVRGVVWQEELLAALRRKAARDAERVGSQESAAR